MGKRTAYYNAFLNEQLEEGETKAHFFYVMRFAPLTEYLFCREFTMVMNSHLLVSFTNKRLLVCEMDAITGKLNGNVVTFRQEDIKNVSCKKGLLHTKITVTFSDESVAVFRPKNICIGLPSHKKHLKELVNRYSN